MHVWSAGLSYPLKLAVDGGASSFLPAMPDDEEQVGLRDQADVVGPHSSRSLSDR